MTPIYLLGTSALDPIGPARMQAALATLKPDRITLGATGGYLAHLRGEYIERNLTMLQEGVAKGLSQDRAKYIENHIRNVFNYQFFAPIQYAEKTEIPVHLIGNNKEIERSRQRLEKMVLDPKDAEHHYFIYFKRESDKNYEQFGRYVNGVMHFGNLISPLEKEIIATEARGIKETAKKWGGKIIQVCGLRDCLDAYIDPAQTIRSSIKELEPTVIFLNQYDWRSQDVN